MAWKLSSAPDMMIPSLAAISHDMKRDKKEQLFHCFLIMQKESDRPKDDDDDKDDVSTPCPFK
jgi:hypothetical protein